MKQACKQIVLYVTLFFLGSATNAMLPDDSQDDQNPFLHHCIIRKDKGATKVALKIPHSGRIHDENVRWLYIHLRTNDFDSFVELLASPDTNPDANLGAIGKTAMGLAYQYNFDDKFILKMHQADEELKPLLVFAAMHQKYDFVKRLLRKGARTDAKDERGNTAMHYAANLNDVVLMTLLHEHRAPLNIQNDDGMTPLHVAATQGNGAALETLLSYSNIACNLLNKNGDTPLHMVIAYYPKHRSNIALMTCLNDKRFELIPDGKGRSIATLLKTYLPAGHKLRIWAEQQDVASTQKSLEQLNIN